MEMILVALIASVPPTLAAVGAYWKAGRTDQRVGNPNGSGSLVNMMQTVIEQQGAFKAWLDTHELRHAQDAINIGTIAAAAGGAAAAAARAEASPHMIGVVAGGAAEGAATNVQRVTVDAVAASTVIEAPAT